MSNPAPLVTAQDTAQAVPWDSLRRAARAVNGAAGAPDGLQWSGEGWRVDVPEGDPRRPWLDLYLPICNGGHTQSWVVGHLGQSLDGFIATCSGDSNFVTGRENIRHLHRMRALCDAVIVGAGTVASDDPQLTTRLVEGPNPLRVVLDPRRRLRDDHKLFTDGAAPTLRVVCEDSGRATPADGSQELVIASLPDGRLDLPALLRALAARGCHRVFVEGGGETVSSFLATGLLDRLHIAIAPLIIGSGRPAIRLAERTRLGDCLRPSARIYRMGDDVLYDFDLRCGKVPAASNTGPGLARIY